MSEFLSELKKNRLSRSATATTKRRPGGSSSAQRSSDLRSNSKDCTRRYNRSAGKLSRSTSFQYIYCA